SVETCMSCAEETREDERPILRSHVVGEGERERPFDQRRVLEAGESEEEALLLLGIVGGAGTLARDVALVQREVAASCGKSDDGRHEVRVERGAVLQVALEAPTGLGAHPIEAGKT